MVFFMNLLFYPLCSHLPLVYSQNLYYETHYRVSVRTIHTDYYFHRRHIAVGNSFADCSENVTAVITVLKEIGFVVNKEKSS